MRYPEGHKEAVRASIVENAARALRREGLAGVSIPALMKKAGLTHGGFYVHFANRDELVAAAVLAAAEDTGARVLSREAGDLAASLEAYLSREHVAHPEEGCVVAALGGEGRHQPAPVRRAFALAARGLIALVEEQVRRAGRAGHAKAKAKDDDDVALAVAARMVGAVVLARLVDDDRLADRILAAARRV
jgi:TetR/AcrR family transcriptional repressor of nem operon